MDNILNEFDLTGKTAVITGGGGFLGNQHAEAILEAGGNAVIWDIDENKLNNTVDSLKESHGEKCRGIAVDITSQESIDKALRASLDIYGNINILINNAANDPKVSEDHDKSWSRFENITLELWNDDINVGLTGAFLCSQRIGKTMALEGGGVILNIASDLGVIAPDQRLYRQEGLSEKEQPVKPVTYSVVKHGMIGLTKYLATYWADKNIRANSISPGGVYNNQPEEFLKNVHDRIPMGRLAEKNEYKAAVIFLVSDASSYMTGANLIIDGGRCCW